MGKKWNVFYYIVIFIWEKNVLHCNICIFAMWSINNEINIGNKLKMCTGFQFFGKRSMNGQTALHYHFLRYSLQLKITSFILVFLKKCTYLCYIILHYNLANSSKQKIKAFLELKQLELHFQVIKYYIQTLIICRSFLMGSSVFISTNNMVLAS